MHISASPTQLPDVFCWSRMGVESGEQLQEILVRKELERRANAGIFLWGLGNSLGDGVRHLAGLADFPEVLFSPIRGSGAVLDVSPSRVVVWLDYVDRNRKLQPLPIASFVTSRGETIAGSPKKTHYALFCQSKEPVALSHHGTLNFAELRNITTRKFVGYSQVTAVVEKVYDVCATKNAIYPVAFRAQLVEPYYAQLATPVLIEGPDLSSVSLAASTDNESAWLHRVVEIKTRLRSAVSQSFLGCDNTLFRGVNDSPAS